MVYFIAIFFLAAAAFRASHHANLQYLGSKTKFYVAYQRLGLFVKRLPTSCTAQNVADLGTSG
jgi:hypothetical protein